MMSIESPSLQTILESNAPVQQYSLKGIPQYTSCVIREISHFSTMALEWDTLLKATKESNISLHHAWLLEWLKLFTPDQLLIILVRDNQGILRAAAPLLISRSKTGLASRLLRRLQFIGTAPDLYDWMKILIHPEAEFEPIMNLIANEIIRNRSRWDLLDLRFFGSLTQLMALDLKIKSITEDSQLINLTSISYIDLPEDFSQYSTHLRKKKYHSDLKRIHNNLQKDFNIEFPRLVVHKPCAESDSILEIFLESHKNYWKERGYLTEYARHPKIVNFYKSLYREFSGDQADWKPVFEFSTLELGNEIISYHFDIQTCYWGTGCLCSYKPEAKKYRPGNLHIEAIIERTHQLGKRRFIFGRGDEAYKNQWKIEKAPLWHLLAFRSKKAQLFWNMDRRLKAQSQKSVKRLKSFLAHLRGNHQNTLTNKFEDSKSV